MACPSRCTRRKAGLPAYAHGGGGVEGKPAAVACAQVLARSCITNRKVALAHGTAPRKCPCARWGTAQCHARKHSLRHMAFTGICSHERTTPLDLASGNCSGANCGCCAIGTATPDCSRRVAGVGRSGSVGAAGESAAAARSVFNRLVTKTLPTGGSWAGNWPASVAAGPTSARLQRRAASQRVRRPGVGSKMGPPVAHTFLSVLMGLSSSARRGLRGGSALMPRVKCTDKGRADLRRSSQHRQPAKYCAAGQGERKKGARVVFI